MIGAALLALPGVVLLAAGTPRQADALFHGRLCESHRRACRIAGLGMLTASLCVALGGGDRARYLVGWIGAIGIESLLIALLIALRTAPAPPNPSSAQSCRGHDEELTSQTDDVMIATAR